MGFLTEANERGYAVDDRRCLSLIIGHTDYGVPIYKDNIRKEHMKDFNFDKSTTGDISTADNIVIDTELTVPTLGINTGDSLYTIAYNIPLEMIWQPLEDISTYELAMCVPFIGRRNVMRYEICDSMTYLKHFKIIDYNKK